MRIPGKGKMDSSHPCESSNSGWNELKCLKTLMTAEQIQPFFLYELLADKLEYQHNNQQSC